MHTDSYKFNCRKHADTECNAKGMSNITTKIPYMVLPGNHEASCAEFDGPGNLLTAYLNNGSSNTTTGGETSWGGDLTYYSCPPSQRYNLLCVIQRN